MFICRNLKTKIVLIPKISAVCSISLKMSDEKKLKIEANTIGMFHCDEVLACFMLKSLPEYENSAILRSRDNTLLNQCEIVVDVGGTFDAELKRFDHHQKSFKETFTTLRPKLGDNGNIRLSSAGLIYVHYGERVIQEILQKHKGTTLSEEDLQTIFLKLYRSFIQEIDAIDNGVPMFDQEPLYRISSCISSRVKAFNPNWTEEKTDPERDELFHKAREYVGNEFKDRLYSASLSWLPARTIVENAIKKRHSIHKSGEIIELEKFAPWQEHLYELEKKHDCNIKYVLYPNGNNDFRVICVPVVHGSFVCRKFLHKKWRGIRDEKLEEISGLKGIKFCHETGFIGGHSTRDGSLKMAEISLEAEKD